LNLIYLNFISHLESFSSVIENSINNVNDRLKEDKKLVDSNYNELYENIKDIEKVYFRSRIKEKNNRL